MDILHLTGTFGRLDHSELSLSPGLNVLYAPNETGKSTWGAFIRTCPPASAGRWRTRTAMRPGPARPCRAAWT